MPAKTQEGKPITDGVLEVSNTDTGRKITTKTNKNGEYTAIGLTPGSYDVTLMRNDKQVDAVTKIPVTVGDMREVNFDLKKDLAAKGAPARRKSSSRSSRKPPSRTRRSRA